LQRRVIRGGETLPRCMYPYGSVGGPIRREFVNYLVI
jgi:hypothetical protein